MVPQDNTIPAFEEVQQLRHWSLWVLMAVITGVLSIGFMHEFSKPDPDQTEVVVSIVLLCIYFVPITILMFYAKLITRIDKNGITYGWNIPTKDLNFVPRENIASCSVITHKFVGYGYKLTKKYGIVYSSRGKQGLQLTTHGGEKILIGTLKPIEMQNTLTSLGFLTV